MLTNLILDKLGLFYDDLAKPDRSNSPSISYGSLITRIIDNQGCSAGRDIFSEYGEQTFNRMIRKIFPEVRLNGGKETWYYHLLKIIEYKHCGPCNTAKMYSEFGNDKSLNSGISPICKQCRSQQQKGQYSRNIESHQKSYLKNRGVIAARKQQYKHDRALRVPAWYITQKEQIEMFYHNCPQGYHVDHIIPLKGRLVSGLHVIENLQYLLAEDNLAKGNKYILEDALQGATGAC